MAEIRVSQADVASLSELLPDLAGPAPAKELLTAVIDAISYAIGTDDEVVVTVVQAPPEPFEEQSITDQFHAAFAAEPAAALAGTGVKVKVFKVGR